MIKPYLDTIQKLGIWKYQLNTYESERWDDTPLYVTSNNPQGVVFPFSFVFTELYETECLIHYFKGCPPSRYYTKVRVVGTLGNDSIVPLTTEQTLVLQNFFQTKNLTVFLLPRKDDTYDLPPLPDDDDEEEQVIVLPTMKEIPI